MTHDAMPENLCCVCVHKRFTLETYAHCYHYTYFWVWRSKKMHRESEKWCNSLCLL